MNLYLDTSALVKLYVQEVHTADVRRAVAAAEVVATSRVAYPEARAALARRHREGSLGARACRTAARALDRDLPSLAIIELTAPLAREAGELAALRSLRGFDAIHLASALSMGRLLGAPPRFLAYDTRLVAAAREEGLAAP